MTYSKKIDEIIRNMNRLIVRIRDTAEYTRKNRDAAPDAAAFYSAFRDLIAADADDMADELSAIINRITDIPQHPDEISARFLILRTLETVERKSGILVFQIRLLLARARPEHRAAFKPISDQYTELAQNVQIEISEIAEYFRELTVLIFQDMRENAVKMLREATTAGRLAAKRLSAASSLPYNYLAEEIYELTDELSSLTLEDISVSVLEDSLFRLDIVASAAKLDLLRMPSHRQLLDGIPAFRDRLEEVVLFFRELSADVFRELTGQEEEAALGRTAEADRDGAVSSNPSADTDCSNITFSGSILLFYLKGEIRKLAPLLSAEQKSSFDRICREMRAAIRLCPEGNETSPEKITEALCQICEMLFAQAEELDSCGGPVRFIAEEIRNLTKAVTG
ncbi:MAG: hypothetical protein NC541_14325 [bacterium]|nr:hypothetical protein [bacterium]